jgi:hypothetical protein
MSTLLEEQFTGAKFGRSDLLYCSQFCEENVYQMAVEVVKRVNTNNCDRVSSPVSSATSAPVSNSIATPASSASFYAVLISSRCRQTPIWHQLAGTLDEPVLWDYHVIFVAKGVSKIDEITDPIFLI